MSIIINACVFICSSNPYRIHWLPCTTCRRSKIYHDHRLNLMALYDRLCGRSCFGPSPADVLRAPLQKDEFFGDFDIEVPQQSCKDDTHLNPGQQMAGTMTRADAKMMKYSSPVFGVWRTGIVLQLQPTLRFEGIRYREILLESKGGVA